MAVYVFSDVHLRSDQPDRGERLARLVDGLNSDDRLIVVGDLCDFWFASRRRKNEPLACPGLRALARFRDREGSIELLVGNHDAWLGPFYEKTFGARIVAEPYEFEAFGLRVVVAHGHLLGARSRWKAAMESEAFLKAFAQLPRPLANGFEQILETVNRRGRAASNLRHLAIYRAFANSLADRVDAAAFGHVHEPFHDDSSFPKLFVLGGWLHAASYLKIDRQGARLEFRSAAGETIDPTSAERRHDGEGEE